MTYSQLVRPHRDKEPMKIIIVPDIILDDVLESLKLVMGCRAYAEKYGNFPDETHVYIVCRGEKELDIASKIVKSVFDRHPIIKEIFGVEI
ncbi:hypothetical protein J4526_01525 [Desulfurococcaceae archaeon MEX13E-LK6-19]|nr:hypothetical protein J4526_01525 [Desulfurococcaceae archaeon MEX13E-LK6-19]